MAAVLKREVAGSEEEAAGTEEEAAGAKRVPAESYREAAGPEGEAATFGLLWRIRFLGHLQKLLLAASFLLR